MYPQKMTSDDLQEGMRVTIQVAHRLKAELDRYPTPAEIKWRTATHFQLRNPQGDSVLTRRQAMTLAQQMMDVVSAAADTTP